MNSTRISSRGKNNGLGPSGMVKRCLANRIEEGGGPTITEKDEGREKGTPPSTRG